MRTLFKYLFEDRPEVGFPAVLVCSIGFLLVVVGPYDKDVFVGLKAFLMAAIATIGWFAYRQFKARL